MANSTFASNAYAAAQQLATGATSLPKASLGGADGTLRPDFGAMLSSVVGATADTGIKADQQMMTAAAGKADVVDIVTAVAEAEAAIETIVAVRDRMIAAYQEIMQMPV